MAELINATQICALCDISIYTLNNWYRFKQNDPDNQYAKMLPEFTKAPGKTTRLWKTEDVAALLTFKATIPHGRKGILGDVTQIYTRKERNKKNAKSKCKKTV